MSPTQTYIGISRAFIVLGVLILLAVYVSNDVNGWRTALISVLSGLSEGADRHGFVSDLQATLELLFGHGVTSISELLASVGA